MPANKVTTLEDAIGRVQDGDVVALQNMATQLAPMAAVRELIRQDKRNLGLVCLVGGIPVDWLSAAGVIDRFIGAAVSLEQFGLCQQYRKAVEAQRITVEELSETALNARIGAGARNLPFLPTRGLIGTDLIDLNDNLVMVDDPFDGPPLVACRALKPDVCLVHVHRCDASGNAQIEPTIVWPELGGFPFASSRVIVTCEEVVSEDVLRRNPDRTVLPGFMVDAVVEVPYGAHPTSCNPFYGYDTRLHLEWGRAAREDDTAQEFLDRVVRKPADQADYLDAVGGAETITRIQRWDVRP